MTSWKCLLPNPSLLWRLTPCKRLDRVDPAPVRPCCSLATGWGLSVFFQPVLSFDDVTPSLSRSQTRFDDVTWLDSRSFGNPRTKNGEIIQLFNYVGRLSQLFHQFFFILAPNLSCEKEPPLLSSTYGNESSCCCCCCGKGGSPTSSRKQPLGSTGGLKTDVCLRPWWNSCCTLSSLQR